MIEAKIDEIYFGPDEDIESFILKRLNSSRETIRVMAFWFTWKPIADCLIEANNRGIKVEVLLDSRSSEIKRMDVDKVNETLIPEYLTKHGIPQEHIHIYNGELLHHKIILIDKETVLTGTCNFFNASINRHEEHYMSIISSELLEKFNDRFNLLKEKSKVWKEN